MTRLPTESRDYEGLSLEDGPEYGDYKVGPLCCVPGCARLVDHAHHVVRRSELAGPYSWVRMPDGIEIGNVVGLCFNHHNDVTENRSRIQYAGGVYFWIDEVHQDKAVELIPQPPHLHHEDESVSTVVGNSVIEEREVCPGCGRKLPKPKIESPVEEPRVRKTWAVAVPFDEQENGADILDGYVESLREKLDDVGISYSTETFADGTIKTTSKAKYYVLSTSLGLFLQHFDEVVADS